MHNNIEFSAPILLSNSFGHYYKL